MAVSGVPPGVEGGSETVRVMLAALLAHVEEAVVGCRRDGTITFASPAVRTLAGYDPSDLVGTNLAELLHPDDLTRLTEGLSRWAGRPGAPRGEAEQIKAADGSWVWVHYDASYAPELAEIADLIFTIRPAGTVDPARHELLQRLINEDRLVRLASAFVDAGPERFDEGLERALQELAGLEWITRASVWLVEGPSVVLRAAWEAAASAPRVPLQKRARIERSLILRRLAAGEEVHIRSVRHLPPDWVDERRWLQEAGVRSLLAVPLTSEDGFSGFLMVEVTLEEIGFDATHLSTMRSAASIIAGALARHEAEIELADHARRDALTGVGNRWALKDAAEEALAGISSGELSGIAISLLDLDDFRRINDAAGHIAGDAVIASLAERLGSVAGGSSVFRLGGDEFIVLMRDVADVSDALARTERLMSVLSVPFEVDDHAVSLTASVGLVHTSDPEIQAEELLRRADLAMHRAKRGGGNRIEGDDESHRQQVAAALRRESDLRSAVEHRMIEAYLQPEWELTTGTLVGAEALARWRHPTEGLLSAGRFIEMAERCALVGRVGEQVLQAAAGAVARWRQEGLLGDTFTLRVNVSPVELRVGGLVERIEAALGAAGLPPSCLCLEITESALLARPEDHGDLFESIRDVGIGLAVDDFGTGYSSLKRLREFPITGLKVDRCFVERLGASSADEAIVQTVVDLARALDAEVVAEGVETPEQLRALLRLGCGRAQGFLLARPEPISSFELRLREGASPDVDLGGATAGKAL